MKLKKFLAVLLVLVIGIGLIPNITFHVFAQGDEEEWPTVQINVANKIDVALAVGPTNVDYSTFEEDLRYLLSLKQHPIPENDLYITASMAMSANTTSEFSWWVYDHTRPAASPYNGVKNVSDASKTYIENDLGNTTTSSSQGTVNTTPGSTTYTPDPTNPDINNNGRHPYNGISAHMMESNGGATMDFYGYAHDSYKDFRYLPNDQATKKVFEFAIQEFLAYDALDGVGFFFNLDITGSYENKTQVMSGYLLFLNYNSSGKGAAMVLYKFQNVNTYRFHQSMNTTTATTTTAYTIATYTEGSGNKFVEVGRSSVYNQTDVYRRIKLEVYPTYACVYYNGSATNASVLTTPIAENATPVNFGAVGSQVVLDQSYITSYGFGPMSSYLSHTCARPTHIALQNLSMVVDKVRSLPEVVRMPAWHENTYKFLVNLNEEHIEDFDSQSITAELLNRLRNDDIYYIGWCSNENSVASENFLIMHDLKGEIVNIDAVTSYWSQLQMMADAIYERYWKENESAIVLVTDHVVLDVDGADRFNTADLEYPNGKWKVIHSIDGFDNPDSIYEFSGVTLPDLDLQFTLPGTYYIYYRDHFITSVIAHRAPIASIAVDLSDPLNPIFASTSYDLDDTSDILVEEWSYIDLDTMIQSESGVPSVIVEDHTYLITLTVTDKWGATASVARQIFIPSDSGGDPGEQPPPFADFTLVPNSILLNVGNQNIAIGNNSYDPRGQNITSNFTITRNGAPFTAVSITGSDSYSFAGQPVGNYVVTLVVTNEDGVDSVPITRSFTIVEDTIAPTASASPTAPQVFNVNTNVTLSFSDLGGSGFSQQRFMVTSTATQPDADDPGWSSWSSSNSRTVNINVVGANYIHYHAVDRAGNETYGYFGAYTLVKENVSLALSVSPAGSQVYGQNIVFRADLTSEATPPTGRVYFYMNGVMVGYGTVVNDGDIFYATYSFMPAAAGSGQTISATYEGDTNHNSASNSGTYTITQSSAASVTVGTQTNRIYDGTPYAPTDILVTGAAAYKTEYVGVSGTSYPRSETPPTGAGTYQVIVTTTDANYITKSDYAAFEITRRELTLSLATNVSSGIATGNVVLTVDIANAVDLPAGKIQFYAGGTPLGSPIAITGDNGDYSASYTWTGILAGTYDFSAAYIEGTNDNYTALGSAAINDFGVYKQDQPGFGFTDSSIDKTYGDAGFTLPAATGAQTSEAVTYSLLSGSAVITFDPDTLAITIKGTGTAVIQATAPADNAYNQATATITIHVAQKANTLTATLGNVPYGTAVSPQIILNESGGVLIYTYVGRDGTVYEESETPPTALGKYTVTIVSAETANYLSGEITLNFEIVQNTGATVTLGTQTNRVYDGTPFSVTGISVTGATTYSVIYTGTGSTVYNSTAAPTDAGTYSVTVTTTDGNYAEKTDSAVFTITPRALTLNLTVNGNNPAVATDDIPLAVDLSNSVDLPTGAIQFYINGAPLGSPAAIICDDGWVVAGCADWLYVLAGSYNISASYILNPAGDNYTADSAEINGYDVYKQNQTGFGFAGSTINKTFGDAAFTIAATGGQSQYAPTYSLQSGGSVISFNPATGTVTIIGTGMATILATKPADDAWNAAIALLTINVGLKDNTLVIACSSIHFGETLRPQIITNESGSALTYLYTGRDGTLYDSDIAPVGAGNYTLTVTSAVTAEYKTATASVNFEILKSDSAAVTVPAQSNKTYDSTAYAATGIAVTGATSYKIEYEGTGGTSYARTAAPPAGAGTYRVIVTTTDPNYVEKSASASFEILKRELSLTLDAAASGYAMEDVELSVTVGNAVNRPGGSIQFYIDGVELGDPAAILYSGGKYVAVTDEWAGVPAGTYTITATYIPAAGDNYTTISVATIMGFSIGKQNQTGFGFANDIINKTYGDAAFTLPAATGGESTGSVTYTLTSGNGVVSFDPATSNVTILAAGTAIIQATKTADGAYNQTTATITILVAKKANNLDISCANTAYGVTVKPQVNTNESGGFVNYTYEGRDGTTYIASATAPTAIGKYTVTGTSAATANFLSAIDSAEFEITPCACDIDSIIFEDTRITVDYCKLQTSVLLEALADVSTCGLHSSYYTVSYALIGAPAPDAFIDSDNMLFVTDRTVGHSFTVRATVIQTDTGVTLTKDITVTVVKGAAQDTETRAYNKNTNGDLLVNISAYPSEPIGITWEGKTLAEGMDYDVIDGAIIISQGFINEKLSAGEHDLLVQLGNDELTIHIIVAHGTFTVNMKVSYGLPDVTVESTLATLLRTSSDEADLDNGYDVQYTLIIAPWSNADEVTAINQQAALNSLTVGFVVDLSLIKIVGGQNPVMITAIPAGIRVVLELPEDVVGMAQYAIVRTHENGQGEIEITLIEATLEDPNHLSFVTDQFSSFGVLIRPKNSSTPQTGDTTSPHMWFAAGSMMILTGTIIIERRRKKAAQHK